MTTSDAPAALDLEALREEVRDWILANSEGVGGPVDCADLTEEQFNRNRAFLARLLTQLTDAQLHDLFAASRFPERWDAQDRSHAATVDQWVDAFKKKRDQIVNAHCSAALAAAR